MVQHVIDERRWQAGMRDYIEANLWGNTDGRIYFSHMQHAINTVPPYKVCFVGSSDELHPSIWSSKPTHLG